MKTYIGSGRTLVLTAPYGGVRSGYAYVIGSLIVVATHDADAGELFNAGVEGVFRLTKPTDEAWTEGQRIYWDAGASNFTVDPGFGANLEVGAAAAGATEAATAGRVRLEGLSLTSAGATAWDAAMVYPAGHLAVDRGGIWQAMETTENSRPVSGNAAWSLRGGPAYVDVILDPEALQSAPFYANPAADPGYIAIPAPGDGWINFVMPWLLTIASEGDPWAQDPAIYIFCGQPATGDILYAPFNVSLSQDFSSTPPQNLLHFANAYQAAPGVLTHNNLPITIQTTTDVTDGGSPVGTRSALIRIFYMIVPSIITA